MYIFGGSGGESLWFNDLSYIDLGQLFVTLVPLILSTVIRYISMDTI